MSAPKTDPPDLFSDEWWEIPENVERWMASMRDGLRKVYFDECNRPREGTLRLWGKS